MVRPQARQCAVATCATGAYPLSPIHASAKCCSQWCCRVHCCISSRLTRPFAHRCVGGKSRAGWCVRARVHPSCIGAATSRARGHTSNSKLDDGECQRQARDGQSSPGSSYWGRLRGASRVTRVLRLAAIYRGASRGGPDRWTRYNESNSGIDTRRARPQSRRTSASA